MLNCCSGARGWCAPLVVVNGNPLLPITAVLYDMGADVCHWIIGLSVTLPPFDEGKRGLSESRKADNS